jgi:hypothetical protein
MHAVRVPMLGLVVAMLLLIAENLGANAYRAHTQANEQPQLSEQMASPAPFARIKRCHDRPHKGE